MASLCDEGRITAADPVVVVGAGVAGVTAAMTLLDRGMSVRVIERNTAPFQVQRQGGDRWIEPELFDFPLGNWRHAGEFPGWTDPPRLLRWYPGRSAKVAILWQHHLAELQREFGSTLKIDYDCEVRSIEAGTIRVHSPSGEEEATAKCVLLCTGPGVERTSIGDFGGEPFWSDPPKDYSGQVLISGGGDGALQDFLLCATGSHARELFFGLFPAGVPSDVMFAIAEAEDHLYRRLPWSPDDALLEVHVAFDALVRDLLGRDPDLAERAARSLRPGRAVTLAHPLKYFGVVYAINRLMVLTLLTACPGLVHRRSEAHVETVSGKTVCFAEPGGKENFDVIVLRHGVTLPEIEGLPKQPQMRQPIPFTVKAAMTDQRRATITREG